MKSKKIKFLYITREKYPTYRVDLTELFSDGLSKKGHCIDWHMDSSCNFDQTCLEINNNEKVFLSQISLKKGILSKLLNRWYSLLHTFKTFKIVKKNEYDFVQVRDKVLIALIALIAARRKKIPFYYWLSFPHSEANILRSKECHWKILPIKKMFFYIRGHVSSFFLYKMILPKADFVFVQSTRMLEDLIKKGVPAEKMMAVPMGINLENVDFNSPLSFSPELKDKKILVYLGTMIHERRIDFLLEMLPKVMVEFPEVVLLLVGSASKKEMNFLKQRAFELGIQDSVVFTGFVPMEEGWNYIRSAKVGLSPFPPSPILDSTSPTKLVEYMAWAIPVVANTHPDQSEVINESGAGFAVNYTPEDFSEACIDILRNPKKSEQMGRAGVLYVKRKRSYAALSTELEKKYLQLLSKECRPN